MEQIIDSVKLEINNQIVNIKFQIDDFDALVLYFDLKIPDRDYILIKFLDCDQDQETWRIDYTSKRIENSIELSRRKHQQIVYQGLTILDQNFYQQLLVNVLSKFY